MWLFHDAFPSELALRPVGFLCPPYLASHWESGADGSDSTILRTAHTQRGRPAKKYADSLSLLPANQMILQGHWGTQPL